MIVAETIADVRAQVSAWKKEGYTVGLVPTMGYLHEGHASLVDKAAECCDRVVASVFVNPTQFAPGEDLESYPRDFEHDCGILEEHGCDMVNTIRNAETAVRKDKTYSFQRSVHSCCKAV